MHLDHAIKNNPDLICFIHIEKCGGITFHTMMHNEMTGYISPNPGFGEFLTADQLRKITKWYPLKVTGVGGHRVGAYLDYEETLSKDIGYVTMFRDPIKRFLSHLNWQKNIMSKSWTLESFCEDGYFNDFQCFRVAGERNADKAISILQSKQVFAGMIEEFDLSMVMLQEVYPQLSLKYEIQNAKSYSDESSYKLDSLSPEQVRMVNESNKQDLILFDYVNTRFEEERKRIPNLEQKVKAYQENNKTYKFSRYTLIKRKISNAILSYLIQPCISKRVS